MPDYPHVIVDLRHRSLEVILAEGPIEGTLEFDDAHLVDVDAEGRVISVEVLTLDRLLVDEMAEEFGFMDQLPAIHEALNRTLPPRTIAASVYPEPKTFVGESIIEAADAASTKERDGVSHIPPKEITLQRG
jgi:hypothetical protein